MPFSSKIIVSTPLKDQEILISYQISKEKKEEEEEEKKKYQQTEN